MWIFLLPTVSCRELRVFQVSCHQRGHVIRCCPKQRRIGSLNKEEDDTEQQRFGKCLSDQFIDIQTVPPLYVIVNINGKQVRCEVNCGASVSVMSSVMYDKHFTEFPLYKM